MKISYINFLKCEGNGCTAIFFLPFKEKRLSWLPVRFPEYGVDLRGKNFLLRATLYRLEARKRNLHNKEAEETVASEGLLIAKISLPSLYLT